jgi:uncharacterized protein YecE (DUF72 family)
VKSFPVVYLERFTGIGMVDIFIGTMGFSYKDWEPSFYPQKLAAGDYLGYYSGFFNAVEVDSTFYGIPPLNNIERWKSATPEGFHICAKTPKLITHEAGLINVEKEMGAFLDVMRQLGPKLGAILIQFPPSFGVDQAGLLASFRTRCPGCPFAVEFRNRSWYTRKRALPRLTGYAGRRPSTVAEKVAATTDFHISGSSASTRFSHHDRTNGRAYEPDWWKERLRELPEKVKEVYCFFNNDYSGHAPATALRFMELVGMPVEGTQPPQQGRLF